MAEGLKAAEACTPLFLPCTVDWLRWRHDDTRLSVRGNETWDSAKVQHVIVSYMIHPSHGAYLDRAVRCSSHNNSNVLQSTHNKPFVPQLSHSSQLSFAEDRNKKWFTFIHSFKFYIIRIIKKSLLLLMLLLSESVPQLPQSNPLNLYYVPFCSCW